MNICTPASLPPSHSHGPEVGIDGHSPLPEPEPPPSLPINPEPPPSTPVIYICDVPPEEYVYDSFQPIGVPFTSTETMDPPPLPPDISYFLWDKFMFPTSELEDRTITSATTLKLLAINDNKTFTSPIDKAYPYPIFPSSGGWWRQPFCNEQSGLLSFVMENHTINHRRHR